MAKATALGASEGARRAQGVPAGWPAGTSGDGPPRRPPPSLQPDQIAVRKLVEGIFAKVKERAFWGGGVLRTPPLTPR